MGFRGLVGAVVDPIAVPDHLGGGDAADCLQHQSEELAGSGDPYPGALRRSPTLEVPGKSAGGQSAGGRASGVGPCGLGSQRG